MNAKIIHKVLPWVKSKVDGPLSTGFKLDGPND